MVWRRMAWILTANLLAGGLLAGCGPDKTIELRYQRPSEVQITQQVRRIGIAEFGGQTPDDRRWGEIASDRLAAILDEYNRKFSRYELVDRKRLKAIMDERDLQIAISDSASADKAGKLAKVDAMIYGNVSVSSRDDRATRMVYDYGAKTMKPVPYTKRHVMTAVSFSMDDVGTGKTITTISCNREYDSDKDGQKTGIAGMGKMLGLSGDSLPPRDQKIGELMEECVQDFVRRISPHEVVAKITLQKGKGNLGETGNKVVETGNKLAAAGDYAEALEVYNRVIADRPDDDGAVFNAGVMYEATGDLKKAEEFYDKAFKLSPKEEYVQARLRVRTEGKH